MANLTLAIPNDLYGKMRRHREIRWTELVRQIIQKKMEDFELLEKLTAKSRLTEKDVEEIGNKIKEGIARKHGLK